MDQQPPRQRKDNKGMMMHSNPDSYGLSTPIAPRESQQERIQLPGSSSSAIGPNDVLCGRGKESFNHSGNKRFRETITNSLDSYTKAETRVEKSLVVLSIYDGIRTRGGRFLKKDSASGHWYELSDQQTKEKIAHAVRDAVNSTEARKKTKKPLKKSEPLLYDSERESYKTESPAMEESTLYPSYARSSMAQHHEAGSFASGSQQHHAFSGGSSVYHNLEAATRDMRSSRPDREAVVHSALNISTGVGDPYRPHPFGGIPSSSSASPSMFPFPFDPNLGGASDSLLGQEASSSSYSAESRSSQPRQHPKHPYRPYEERSEGLPYQERQHHAISHASAQRLISRQERPSGSHPNMPHQLPHPSPLHPSISHQHSQSLTDPFLERINEVLGPIAPEDHSGVALEQDTAEPRRAARSEEDPRSGAAGTSGTKKPSL